MRRYASLILIFSLVLAFPLAECSCAQYLAGTDPSPNDDNKGMCGCGCCDGSDSGPCMCGCTEAESPQPTVPAPRPAERADDNVLGAIIPTGLGTVVEVSSQAYSPSEVEWLLPCSGSTPLYLLDSSFRC